MPPVPEFYNFSIDVLGHWARQTPNVTALWWVTEAGDAEKKFTFAEVLRESELAAQFFLDQGIRKGDRVLVILPRVPEWWFALSGLIRIGAIPIPGTPLLTERDIQYRVKTAEISAAITDADNTPKYGAIPLQQKIVVGTAPGWSSFADRQKSSPQLSPNPTLASDPCLLYFTSGTTGGPKMVLHNQVTYALGHEVTGKLWLDLKPGEVFWNMSDTGWAKAAWSSLFGPWQAGACVFTVDARGRFEASSALRVLSRFPVAVWCAPPTALRLVIREELSKYKFPKLRHCVSAGEPLNPEVMSAWEAATGLKIYEGFGQTETVVLIGNFVSMKMPIKPGSMGIPTPGFDVTVVDHQLNEVPPGTEGEVAVRIKPNRPLGLFLEYWKNPEENKARFQGDYYLTGDVAKKDEEGYFWFVGRADDVIKSSGYRIGPFEVESALVEHPAVLESAVVGKPDDTRGAIVKAWVVLRKGIEASEALKTELQEHCKRVTAPYKYPREIEFLPELPKTASGKIRRVELRNRN